MYSQLGGRLRIESLTIQLQGLPAALRGLTIVQLSDFHFDGLRLSESLLNQAIAATNAAKPDLIVLTGDYVTDDPAPIHALAQYLRRLKSRSGIYAVLGNHDLYYRHSQDEVTNALRAANIQVLWNQVTYPLGEGLALVGLCDFWSRQFNPEPVMAAIAPGVTRLVLSHNPDSAECLKSWRVDLQLSGHTHGGQIVIPGVGPLVSVVQRLGKRSPAWVQQLNPKITQTGNEVVHRWDWSQGLHQVGPNLLYVNRGLGTYFPGRFCCPPEVTVITLT